MKNYFEKTILFFFSLVSFAVVLYVIGLGMYILIVLDISFPSALYFIGATTFAVLSLIAMLKEYKKTEEKVECPKCKKKKTNRKR